METQLGPGSGSTLTDDTVEFDRIVAFVASQVLNREAGGDEALERSIACFALALGKAGEKDPDRHEEQALRSFAWLSATFCLQEVYKLPHMTT